MIAIYSHLITNQLEPVLSEFRNKAIPIMLTYFDANLTYLERDSIENYRLKSFGIYLSFDSKKQLDMFMAIIKLGYSNDVNFIAYRRG